LPGRTTIVLTRNRDWSHEGVLVAHTVEEALDLAGRQPGDLMVAGGAEVYTALLPYATHQVLTEVDLEPDGDVHYPQFPAEEWVETDRETFEGYERVWLERLDPAA
jgi:dihydrofolate reductase